MCIRDRSGSADAAENLVDNFDFSTTPNVPQEVLTSSIGHLSDTDGLADTVTLQCREFIYCGDSQELIYSAFSEGSIVVKINGQTAMKYSKATTGTQTTPSFTVNNGDEVKLYNVDSGGINSIWNLQVGGETDNTFFDDKAAIEKPTFEPCTVKMNTATCELTGFLSGEPIDKSTLVECPLTQPVIAAPEAQGKDCCQCPECPELVVGSFFNVDTNTLLSLPIVAQGEIVTFGQRIHIEDTSEGCLANNLEAEIEVEICLDHSAGTFDSHRGFILNTDAGVFTAENAANSIGTFQTGTPNIGIGYDVGEPFNQRAERCVKLKATAAEWLAGVDLLYLSFGGIDGNGANLLHDTLHDMSAEICLMAEGVCDGCS